MAKLLRPDVNTKYQIDFDWWENADKDFNVFLYDFLCSECKERYSPDEETEERDYVDQQTGEVHHVDEMWGQIIVHCRDNDDYIGSDTPTISALLRTLLANGNQPLSPKELHERTGKSDPRAILRLLRTRTGHQQGIFPVEDS